MQRVLQQFLGSGDGGRVNDRVPVVPLRERWVGSLADIRNAQQPHLLVRVRGGCRCPAPPHAGGDELEFGAVLEVRRQAAAEGGDLGGAEEEVPHYAVVRDGSSLGVMHDAVLRVSERDTWRVTSTEDMSLPNRQDREAFGALGELTYGREELENSGTVAHGVVVAEGEDESAT